jgi:hypothetical protein
MLAYASVRTSFSGNCRKRCGVFASLLGVLMVNLVAVGEKPTQRPVNPRSCVANYCSHREIVVYQI